MWYPSGFLTASDRAGYAFFMILVVEFYSVTLGQAVAALSPSMFIAATTVSRFSQYIPKHPLTMFSFHLF